MLLTEINRLLIKGMSNIYLKVNIEKKWPTQNFNFLSLKSLSQCQFWGTCADITKFSNFLVQLKNQRPGRKTVCDFLLCLFWKELWRFKVKESVLFVEQKYKL